MRLLKKIKYKLRTILKLDIIHPENKYLIEKFRYYDSGFIFGSAPTIKNLDLTKISHESLKISMGNFHEHPDINIIKPDVHIFAASHPPITEAVLRDWFIRANERISNDTVILVEARDFELANTIFTSKNIFQYSYGGNLPVNFTKRIVSPTTVAIIALQLCKYLGIQEINLLGIDHDWQSKVGYNHFYDHDKPSLEFYLLKHNLIQKAIKYSGRQGKDRLYKFNALYEQYELIKSDCDNNGINVFNADPFSEFDVFTKKNLDKLIKKINYD